MAYPIGTRFGKLVLLRKSGRFDKRKRPYWFLLCDCGNTTEIAANHLSCTKSCGCARGRWKYEGDEAAFQHLFTAYKHGAIGRDLLFEISREDFKMLTSSKCTYCGTPPSSTHERSGGITKVEPYIFNGVDRVNNDLGYVAGNCVPCCGLCNYMKRNLTKDGFLSHVKKIAAYLEKV